MSPQESKARMDFEVEKSLRYHQRRRAHFERWHRRIMFMVILSGSVTIATVDPWLAGLVTAILGAIGLVFDLSSKARDHALLHRRFTELAMRVRSCEAPTEADAAAWQNDVLAIETEEPPIYWALEADCYNEVLHTRGMNSADVRTLGWPEWLLMDYLPFTRVSAVPPMRAANAG